MKYSRSVGRMGKVARIFICKIIVPLEKLFFIQQDDLSLFLC